MPIDSITVPVGASLIFEHQALPNPLIVNTGMNEIAWSYELNTNKIATYAGEVVQILGCFVGPMQISGNTKDNVQLKAIYDWFRTYMEQAGLYTRDERSIRFRYPTRGWDFNIQVTNIDNYVEGLTQLATEWAIQAEVLSDSGLGFLTSTTQTKLTGALFDATQFDIGFVDGDPRSDPGIGNNYQQFAQQYANNFQSLLGAWAGGDFAHWGFDVLTSPEQNHLNPDTRAYYTNLFGTPYVGGGTDNAVTPGGSTAGGGQIGTAAILDSNQNKYASFVSEKTGLSFTVIAGWVHAESATGSGPSIGYNFLNLSAKDASHSYSGVPVVGEYNNQFAKFSNVEDAATEAVWWLTHWYQSIVSKAGQPDSAQLEAIWKSPWDAGHYGGNGSRLIAAYQAVKNGGVIVKDAVSGSASHLAKEILNSPNFVDVGGGNATSDLRAAAAGNKISGPGGQISLSSAMLGGVLSALQRGFNLGLYVICTGHHFDSLRGHSGGFCTDIATVNGVSINSGSSRTGVLHVLEFYNNITPHPYQLINGGVGGGGANDIGLLNHNMYNYQVHLANEIVQYYGQSTIDQHKNHIHLGY